MPDILIPARGPEDWRQFLAEPDKQWKVGYSARALAYCWHDAQGLPPSVQQVFDESEVEVFHEFEALLLIPEHQVPLPGGQRPSQSDIWILGRSKSSLVSIAVEGKVSEPFGPTLGEWLVEASEGKNVRLEFLTKELGLEDPPPSTARYHSCSSP